MNTNIDSIDMDIPKRSTSSLPARQSMRRKMQSTVRNLNATRVILSTVGALFGFSGFNHGFFEFLQGNKPTNGVLIHAIGEAQRFWVEGTEDAFTIIPNFMVSGIFSMFLGILIIIWSLWFIQTKYGRTVFLGLFILLFLSGGGIGQLAFFIPAWAFGTRLDKPLTWWKKTLPREMWPFLSKLWLPTLVLTTIALLIGMEMAIFGYFPGMTDPDTINSTCMTIVFSSALLNIIAFIAGFGHELLRMEQKSTFQS